MTKDEAIQHVTDPANIAHVSWVEGDTAENREAQYTLVPTGDNPHPRIRCRYSLNSVAGHGIRQFQMRARLHVVTRRGDHVIEELLGALDETVLFAESTGHRLLTFLQFLEEAADRIKQEAADRESAKAIISLTTKR